MTSFSFAVHSQMHLSNPPYANGSGSRNADPPLAAHGHSLLIQFLVRIV